MFTVKYNKTIYILMRPDKNLWTMNEYELLAS